MIEEITNQLENKNICILGFGKEGKSTYEFINKYVKNKTLTIIDENIEVCIDNANVIKSQITKELLTGYDFIFKSPGISFKNIDVTGLNVTSQLDIFLSVAKENVIAVTGTKGKSTTSSLIYKVLKDQKVDAYLLGNIGTPIFEKISNFSKNTKCVIECSSHQLEFVRRSPHISLILNLYPEHLDHYNSLSDYYKSKINICKFQSEDDYLICNLENEKYISEVTKLKSNTVVINKCVVVENNYVMYNDEKLYNINDKRLLLGDHNLKNIEFVLSVAKILKLDMNKASASINSFSGLEHRMEFVGVYENIKFYNDSICTIPQAAINCCEALKDVDTLIIGGMNRGIDYSLLVDYINKSNITNIVCLPLTGHELLPLINKKTYKVDTMKEAAEVSLKVTLKNKSAVLSPAAPSYGYFKNFEDRGLQFKKLLKDSEK